ncbi:MAG: hypothetical protein GX893_01840 [Firmicutes bacterium]|nr:hypothetical protein [Bacillota bacterium]
MAKWIKSMTPEQAWNEFVADSVEMFLSNFRSEGYTDIEAACIRYAADIPIIYRRPFTQSQLDHIANLLKQYIDAYIHRKGGIDKIRFYTDEELDLMDALETQELLEWFKEVLENLKCQ